MRLLHSLLAATALLGLTLTAHADTYADFKITNGTFSHSSSTFSGTFTLDTTTNRVTVASITVVDPSAPSVFNTVGVGGLTARGYSYNNLADKSNDLFKLDLTPDAAGLCLASDDSCLISSSFVTPFYALDVKGGTVTPVALPTAATPEPSSLVLLGTGILGLAGATRRRFLNR